jgi:RNA polymerase sigma-70 factor (ECF subfamily)
MEPIGLAARLYVEGGRVEDSRGFAEFYRSCRALVYPALVATLGDARLAQEATDEALTRAAERWSEVRGFERPVGWVYRVGVNWAMSWRRKLSLRPTRPSEDLDRPQHDALPDVDLVHQLALLPARQRQMLVLRYALGFSVAETAQLLGVATGTVKSGIHRARQQLRDGQEVLDGRA